MFFVYRGRQCRARKGASSLRNEIRRVNTTEDESRELEQAKNLIPVCCFFTMEVVDCRKDSAGRKDMSSSRDDVRM